MAFHETRFPVDVALGAAGGPERRTEIVTLGSGHEERNARWADSRRRYNAGYGVKSLAQLYEVLKFFEERRGRLTGFRWKDRTDWKSCPPGSDITPLDQVIGTGDGTLDVFQLKKQYGSAFSPYTRTISKPVSATIRIAVDGFEKQIGTHFTIEDDTGLVTFTPGNIPASGAIITAGFEFDVPVRFDTDILEVNLTAFEAGDIPNIQLVEIRS